MVSSSEMPRVQLHQTPIFSIELAILIFLWCLAQSYWLKHPPCHSQLVLHARDGLFEIPQQRMDFSEFAVGKAFSLASVFFRQVVSHNEPLFVADLHDEKQPGLEPAD